MTNAAIIFMVVSVSSVVLLTAWCYYTVMRAPRDTHGQPDDVED